MNFQRIAVPLDLSENSLAALLAGGDLASRYGAELHLVHIVEPWPSAAMASPEPYPTQPAETKLAGVAVSATGIPSIHRAVRVGDPVDGILQYVKAQDIDLVVMGSHGRTGFSHLFLGSVAEAVVRRAPCPVLVVRPASPEPQAAP